MDLPHSYVLVCCFFFFFVSLVVVPNMTLAASPYLGAAYLTCMPNTTNGTSLSSSFKRNLNSALQNLTSLSSKGIKYAQTTAGSGDNAVYAMFQCRGDQSTPLCAECVDNVTVRLPQRDCPVSIGARIQLDGCYLRYDNKPFFSLDVSSVIGYCYGRTRDAVILSTINSLVENVTTQAPEQGGFAYTSRNGEYAAAQCLGYLSESECSQCLSHAYVPYRIWCASALGEQGHLTSCYYRFEPYAFLAPLPSPAPGASPMPILAPANASMSLSLQASPLRLPPRQLNESHTGSKTPIIAAIIAAAAIAVIIALCLVLVWRCKASKKREEVGKKEVKRQSGWPQPLVQAKVQVFSLRELEDATRHFHLDNKLGEGGFGSVYKAWRLFTQKKILDLVDAKIGHDFSTDQVIRVAHVGLLCTQMRPYQRPTMSQVVLMLSKKSKILELPCKPAFVDLNESRALGSTPNHQSSLIFSHSSITNTQISIINDSLALSNATQSVSELIDPR